MTHNFEIFTRKSLPVSRDPMVTIQSRGALSLNKAAYAAIGAPQAVELMYDRQDSVIGIRGAHPKAAHAYAPYTAKGNEDGGPHIIAGKAFLGHFMIEVKETRRYPVTVENGVLLIDLKQPGTPVSQNGRAGGAASSG